MNITPYIKAGYAALQIQTHEEQRAFEEVVASCKGIRTVWSWSLTTGLECQDMQPIKDAGDPLKMLNIFCEFDVDPTGCPQGRKILNRSVVVLRDFHLIMKGGNPMLIRRMRDAINIGRATSRHLVIIGCQTHLPPELEKEIVVVEFRLPDRSALLSIAEPFAKRCNQELNGSTDVVLDAGSGLTSIEFENAVAKSIVESGKIEAPRIAEAKADAIKKGGILEIVPPDVGFDDIGGLDELKSWVSKRKEAFTEKARKYGLRMPKGICLFGVQGAGKSMATRAIASELSCPLIRLDAGKLFGGIVGESEANTRSVIHQVEAFGKCVLQVDEIDKGFAGMTGGHDGDSGTTRRVIGTFLTWMAEKKSPVFIVATANDLTKLPPELLRKGRWDELFFIDLPTPQERVEIWRVQIRRHGRDSKKFDLNALSVATNGWTGAEIEALMGESLYTAFDLGCSEPDTEMLKQLSTETQPLSKTMGDQMKALRDWSNGRARAASRIHTETTTTKLQRMIEA